MMPASMAFITGSPPRGRGKVCIAIGLRVSDGITPAWAGKSCYHQIALYGRQDHPRMSREKTMYFEDKYFCRGSPPRRRGKARVGGEKLA